MGQSPWKSYGTDPAEKPAAPAKESQASSPDENRRAKMERLKAEIAAGKYEVSAESLAGRLMRRLRWW
jgi:anti-sigma28 factor (negative regulator of flagellin synthesis)